ncbi:MAG: hypothetical protein AB1921_11880 [Thermodesulfobacteriota bacterium]
MRRVLFLTAAALFLAVVTTALANMQTVDEEALADIQASMGATLHMRGGRAVSNAWAYRDVDGAAGYNTNRGYLFFGSVGYTDTSGAGNINLWNMTLDIGSYGTTEMLIIGFPDIDGRISINDIRIGNCNDHGGYWSGPATWVPATYWSSWPTPAGKPVGSIYLENVSFVDGSALMMWGH